MNEMTIENQKPIDVFSLHKNHPERINREKGRNFFIKNMRTLSKEDQDLLIHSIKLCCAQNEDHDGYKVNRLVLNIYEAFYYFPTNPDDATGDEKSNKFLTRQAALYIHSLSDAELDKFLTAAATSALKKHGFLTGILNIFNRNKAKTI